MLPSDKMYLRCHKKPLGRYFPLTKCIFSTSKSLWADASLRQNASSLLQKASGQMLPAGKMHLRCHKKPLGRYFSPEKCICAVTRSLWADTFLRQNVSLLLQKVSWQILPSDKMYLRFHKKLLCRYFPLTKCILLPQEASVQILSSDKMYLRCHKKPRCRCFPLTKCIFAATRSLCADASLRQNASSLPQEASVQMLFPGQVYLHGLFADAFPKNPVNSQLLDLNRMEFEWNGI